MNETKNKVMVSFSLDREVVQEFDRVVPNGEKSSTMNELMKDFLFKSGSFRKDPQEILAQKALASQKAAEDYEAFRSSFERSESEKEKKLRTVEVEKQRSDLFNTLSEQAKAEARLQVALELGLDPTVLAIPDGLRSSFNSKWKERHYVLLEKKIVEEKAKKDVIE